MEIVKKFLGPKSKYEHDLPYTYEAKIGYIDGDKDYNSYMADTICGLVAYLETKQISPDEVAIFEIFDDKEKQLDISLCLSADKKWLNRDQLCEAFKHHYEGHIYKGGCSFSDRDGTCSS